MMQHDNKRVIERYELIKQIIYNIYKKKYYQEIKILVISSIILLFKSNIPKII